MLKSKLHRMTVTEADLHYEGSATIDAGLMEAADILENERVSIWNIDAGTRFDTYAITGPRGSGVLCINGAAARLVSAGDRVIIATFVEADEAEARAWTPKLVFVDENNRIKEEKGKELPFKRYA
jgi:aspartate 1-decarboxylase